MPQAFGRLLSRLSVGRKLMLIYLLDLSAVIFVSTILINEKFIAIDFARKEVRGNDYLQGLSGALLEVAARGTGAVAAPAPLADAAQAVQRTELAHGEGLQTAEPAAALRQALDALDRGQPDASAERALALGRDLVTRVGNQTNLILDPDLDSYYTMSLLVLRYPELLELVEGMARLVGEGGGADPAAWRTRYLILEGRLDAVASAIAADHAEAFAAGGPKLKAALDPARARLAARIDDFRRMARARLEDMSAAPLHVANGALVDAIRASWADAGLALDGLLRARIDSLVQRMWIHLGTALALLLVILGIVALVARSIAHPLRHLAGVAETVRRTGDHRLRARWDSRDEIGRLVGAFNDMLTQLDSVREAQQELAASARAADAQRALVESTPIALVVTAIPGHEVLHANPPAEAWLGGSRTDPWRHGLEAPVRTRFFQQLHDRGTVDEFEVRWLGGREPAWAVLSARLVRFQGQDAVLTAFAPINHLKLMERRLELLAKVFQASSEAILIVDAERRILTANAAFERHTGYSLRDVVGQNPDLLLPPTQPLPASLWTVVAARGTWQGELQVRRRNDSHYPAWLMVNAVRQSKGEISHFIFTSIDITDRKKSEQRIRFLAEHDVLTELPNRSLATERLRLAIQQAERQGRQVALMFIDLDRFKGINDSLGHHIGDALLRSVARRLVDAVRAGDTVSRLGGDEFLVVLNGIADVQEAAQIVHQRLIPLIRQPHQVEGAELHVSCSVGIAVYPDDALDIESLMRQADTAMYQAKAEGRDGAQFYTAAMTERARQRLHMEAELRHALERGQLELHWQPRVAAIGGELLGVEGLLRWTHPELGAVAPVEFIPLAEECGLIVPIGAWVLDRACAQIASWRAQGMLPLAVSINLSVRQLRDPALLDTVRECLQRHEVPARSLELEITESMLMQNADAHRRQFEALREMGVGIAIDDFGTGYSSLAYLSRFPVDKLKIDRSFVHRMLDDASARAITTAVIGLGHTLGLKVVAEGVERELEATWLREARCDELQGYLFGRPMPAAELPRWRARRAGVELAG